ncbi:hypothetical protein HYPSUDRAFT_655774 [Hypholoma sublateritium FD-334 SS-4]|uniref:Uncharacterized protein n=1 Tax=Hypholoma sublateritium (strain FD-334 SS-4) TaxID=945553 RepID=A0A0D2L650_HYPSF|nr:hypothetical protein HYPSUDRAFT_655774 [Hypholoma sublateritium FD-334 SS-4]
MIMRIFASCASLVTYPAHLARPPLLHAQPAARSLWEGGAPLRFAHSAGAMVPRGAQRRRRLQLKRIHRRAVHWRQVGWPMPSRRSTHSAPSDRPALHIMFSVLSGLPNAASTSSLSRRRRWTTPRGSFARLGVTERVLRSPHQMRRDA